MRAPGQGPATARASATAPFCPGAESALGKPGAFLVSLGACKDGDGNEHGDEDGDEDEDEDGDGDGDEDEDEDEDEEQDEDEDGEEDADRAALLLGADGLLSDPPPLVRSLHKASRVARAPPDTHPAHCPPTSSSSSSPAGSETHGWRELGWEQPETAESCISRCCPVCAWLRHTPWAPSTGKGMVLWLGMLLPASALWVPSLLPRQLLHPVSTAPTCLLRNATGHGITDTLQGMASLTRCRARHH